MLAFDTHKFVKDLTRAGMAVEQAEVLAETYATILTEQVATKADIRALQKQITGLTSDMATLDTSLRAEIAALEERMDLKLQAVEQRLERKIVTTQMIGVLASCTIIGFLLTILT